MIFLLLKKNVRVQNQSIIKINKNKDFEEVRINLGRWAL